MKVYMYSNWPSYTQAMGSHLETLNIITSSINRARLKRELMEHFQEHGMQEQSDGKQVIFVFPEGMHSLLGNISLPD